MSLSTFLVLAIFCLWLISLLQNIQLSVLRTSLDGVKGALHILEDEFNDIQNEHELFSNWFNENDVIIAGVNDSNQKRKTSLASF